MDDAAVSVSQYRTDFLGISLGTEEELAGAAIWTDPTAGQLIGYVSRHGEPLVQITRDMPVPDLGGYTIELRTTPTELADRADWDSRRRALQVAVWAINDHSNGTLADDSWRGYDTTIRIPHRITKVPDGGITGAQRQSTVGVAAAEIGGAGAAAGQPGQDGDRDRSLGRLCPNLTLPWYRDEYIHDGGVQALGLRERIGYALVMSAIEKLATIWLKYPGKLSLLEVKNLWTVRPRTSPRKILETFDDGDMDVALAAIMNRALPGQHLASQWDQAMLHILKGLPMGGHPLPDSTVDGQVAMLFEYRTAPHDEYPYAFWRNGELAPGHYPDHG